MRSANATDPAPLVSSLASLGLAAKNLRPLHTRPRAELEAERLRAETASSRQLADLSLYYVLELPAGAQASKILEQLSALPLIEFAEPEPTPAPPPIDLAPPTPDLSSQQGYRGPAPLGVGAFNVAEVPGGNGANTRIVDIEYSWVLNHEDLELPASTNIDASPAWDPFPGDQGNHGTAVLGELAGKANGYGVWHRAGSLAQDRPRSHTSVRLQSAAGYQPCYGGPFTRRRHLAGTADERLWVKRLRPGRMVAIRI